MDTFRLETNVVVDKFIILHATSKKEAGIILPSPFGIHGLEPKRLKSERGSAKYKNSLMLSLGLCFENKL